MALDDIQNVLLNRVLLRLYEDVGTINAQIHQVHADVAYLVQTGQISDDDAAFILSKVPLATDPATNAIPPTQDQFPIEDSPPHRILPQHQFIVAPEPRRPNAKPPVVSTVMARALWDYNVDGEQTSDLGFFAGDMIEVQESSMDHEDWWEGKVHGRSGLFPSKYVEIIVHSLPPPPKVVKASKPPPTPVPVEYVPYRSTHAAMMAHRGPEGTNAIGLTTKQDEPTTKKGKYDHLKQTVTNSAAGGLGFGAGAAIGGGLVRAIF